MCNLLSLVKSKIKKNKIFLKIKLVKIIMDLNTLLSANYRIRDTYTIYNVKEHL